MKLSPHSEPRTEQIEQTLALESIRRRLLDTGLLAFVILVGPAVIASFSRSAQTGWQPVMVVHGLLFTVFLTAYLMRHRIAFRPRAIAFTSGLLVAGIGGLVTYGLAGMGPFLLALAILFSAMLLGRGYVIAITTLALGGSIAIALAVVFGVLDFDVDFNTYMATGTAWMTSVLTLSTVVAAILGLRRMNASLSGLVNGLATRSDELAEINRELELEVTARSLAEEQLFTEKEKAQVTLHSIGDAVITTDADCRVEYLNAVAAEMTGWSLQDAVGQPIEKVFKIADEVSREPATQPIRECLRTESIVGLANGIVLISRTGEEYLIRDSAAPILKRNGEVIGAVLVAQDATKERIILREAQHQAAHDSLTGLINRREFEIRIERAIQSTADDRTTHTLCYLDLDRFKQVNDAAGHLAGDALLSQIAKILESQVRARDSLARLGGDEFGLLLENCSTDKAYRIALKLIQSVRDTSFSWEGDIFRLGVSIGIVDITSSDHSVSQLLRRADAACYAAKGLGRNRVAIYEQADHPPRHEHEDQRLASRLRLALENGSFSLYRQPIFALDSKDEISERVPRLYEILLRLEGDEETLPGEFIPVAEKVGIMPEIDRWVIRRSLDALGREGSVETTAPRLSINLSGLSIDDDSLSDYVRDEFSRSGVSPDRVCFEITETAAIESQQRALNFIHDMRTLGCRFALDDFGSGLSSLAYLKRLPVDYLKIDGEFIREIDDSPTDRAMVKAMCELGKTLEINMIAEYVETPEIAETLAGLGVDYAQGFSLGEPRPFV